MTMRLTVCIRAGVLITGRVNSLVTLPDGCTCVAGVGSQRLGLEVMSVSCEICEQEETTVVCALCQSSVCDDDAADCDGCGDLLCRDCGEWRVTHRDVLRESPDDEQWFCRGCLS